MNPAVEGYAAAIADETAPGDLGALAGELAAVDELFHDSAELRAAMTDVAVPARARKAVLADLLSGKVRAPAARLCAFAAGAVHAQEVPGAISWVANRLRQAAAAAADAADAASAEETATSSIAEVLGHREARERVGGYAAAVFEDLSVAELETVEDELFRFARIVDATPELRSTLTDREIATVARRDVVEDLLGRKVHAATLRLALYVVVGGRPRDVVGTLDWLVEQVAIARGWRVARVHAGQAVDDEERRRLSESLAHLAGSPVELQVTVDPALLAGVSVQIGDLQLDATARGRLERLREHVTAGGWTDLGFGRAVRAAHRPGTREHEQGPTGQGAAGGGEEGSRGS